MPVAPPGPRSLPLNALRAFEAAARLGGFAAAASELGVSPGAVTAHVKGLEQALGAALFERQPGGVRLTALGTRVLPGFTAAFDQLGLAVEELRTGARPGRVHVAALPAIAQLWLSPRLPALRAAGLEVSVTALEAPANLKRSAYDVNLFLTEAEAGVTLAEDAIFPVCAPALAARLRRPDDLADVPCLSDSAWAEDWRIWAEAALPGRGFVPSGPVYSLYALAVEEAVNGAGVLIGHAPLVARHLAEGRLVAPFALSLARPARIRLWSARSGPLRGAAARLARALAES